MTAINQVLKSKTYWQTFADRITKYDMQKIVKIDTGKFWSGPSENYLAYYDYFKSEEKRKAANSINAKIPLPELF